MPQLIEHKRVGREEVLFRSEPYESLPNFEEVLAVAYSQEIRQEADGTKSLTMPEFTHDGQKEQIVVTTTNFSSAAVNKPKILYLPPYPFPTGLIKNIFAWPFFNDWSQEGITPFDSQGSMAHPYRSARGAQEIYAGTMRMLHEEVREAHGNGQNVGLFGFSFGANAISAYLSYINGLSEQERELALPEKLFVIEGGEIFESIAQGSYKREADPETIQAVRQNPFLLPHQEPLYPDAASRTIAIVNPTDLAVRSQIETWKGAKMYTIDGSHVKAPLKPRNLWGLRRLLRSHFQSLDN